MTNPSDTAQARGAPQINQPAPSTCYCHRSSGLDGLWRVQTPTICAGFILSQGRITRCAPILRSRPALRNTAIWLGP